MLFLQAFTIRHSFVKLCEHIFLFEDCYHAELLDKMNSMIMRIIHSDSSGSVLLFIMNNSLYFVLPHGWYNCFQAKEELLQKEKLDLEMSHERKVRFDSFSILFVVCVRDRPMFKIGRIPNK